MDANDIAVIISLAERALRSTNWLTPNDVGLINKIMNSLDDKNSTIIRNGYPSVFEYTDE